MGELLTLARTASERRPRRKAKNREPLPDGASVAEGSAGASSTPKAGPSRLPKRAAGSSWDVIPIARSEVTSVPPVWSRDGRFYFSASSTGVEVHSSEAPNFARLSTLSSTDPNGHRKPITALILHPTNHLQLITASLDGTIKIWDWVEGRHIRTIRLVEDSEIHQISVGQVAEKWWMFATVTNAKHGKKPKEDGSHLQHRVLRVQLAPVTRPASATENWCNPHTIVGKLRAEPKALMMSPRGTYLVALAGTKAYVYRLPKDPVEQNWRVNCVKFVSDQQFTCGAFAPDRKAGSKQEEWFATGDRRGIIRLWHGLGQAFRQLDAAAVAAQQDESAEKPMYSETEKRLPTTSLHWHAHAVAAIAFTSGGAQILSVGEESVLVQWHLASGKREYIPRLGGRPLLSVAVRQGSRGVEDEYWMGLADGSVVRVGAATGQVSPVGQGVRLDPLRPTTSGPYPLAVHPSTKALVVPSSHPSTLQFIDPIASSVLFDLEVAPSNRVSKRDDKELVPIAVEQVAFSPPRDGRSEWMATVEGRTRDEDEGGGFVKTLKFWRWNGERYIVNTQYPRPHGSENIASLSFSSLGPDQEPLALTACSSGTVKIWHPRQTKKSDNGKSSKKPSITDLYWTARSTFKYRSLGVSSAAFSPDGTLVALAHGNVVSLWDTESNVLVRALESAVVAKKTVFAGSEGRYLVAAGATRGITVWDLLSCEAVHTNVNQLVEVLLGLPTGYAFGYTTGKNVTALAFFAPDSTPEQTIHLKFKFAALAALPSANHHLVGIAATGEIYRFGYQQTAAAPAARAISAAPASRATSIWQEMFGKDAFLDDLDDQPEPEQAAVAVSALQRRAAGHPAQVYDGPSHTLPPVGMLFDAFMDELLGSKLEEEAQAAGEAIEYDAAPTLGAAPLVFDSDSIRTVRDADVAELEVYFRDLLASAPAKPKAAAGLGKAKARPNGVAVAGRSVSTPVKTSSKTAKSPGTPDEPEVVDGKRKSKKRKAPRMSEV
ncbi:NET1-associated nuclear protein 1 [Vanrija albida]|uniref:NET1-associated nuclear protein 1 n=1 Tax=Vanrija albida TaxID=181172 RepID=A0ABR3Q979_9TREE